MLTFSNARRAPVSFFLNELPEPVKAILDLFFWGIAESVLLAKRFQFRPNPILVPHGFSFSSRRELVYYNQF